MKVCVLIIFIMMPWISKAGDWALGWTEGNEKLQIAFVMMIFPLIMNALQYYIIDSFIKLKDTDYETANPNEADESRRRRYDDDEDEASRTTRLISLPRVLRNLPVNLKQETPKSTILSAMVTIGRS